MNERSVRADEGYIPKEVEGIIALRHKGLNLWYSKIRLAGRNGMAR
jgi:hypothetical protein